MNGDQGQASPLPSVFGRYLAVGLLGTAIHFLSTIALVEWVGVAPVPSSAVGFVLTVIVSFALNSAWTFHRSDRLGSRFAKYSVVSVSGLVLNTAIMWIAVERLAWHYLAGLCLVVLVIPPYNFTLNLLWSFRGAADGPPAAEKS